MKKATDLASRCHQSALTCEMIRSEAEVLGAPYVKVITPAPTRWNSHYMMVESILTLKATLQSLREKNENIGVSLFSDEEFNTLKHIEKTLSTFEAASRMLSADKSCTMAVVLTAIVNIHGWLTNMANLDHLGEDLQKLARDLVKALDKQWPNAGSEEDLIRKAHFLHPYYKGLLLKKYNKYESTKLELIDSHPTTVAFTREQEAARRATPELISTEEMDPADQLLMDLSDPSQADQGTQKSPLEIEMATYLALPRPVDKAKVDVLAWWRDHAKTLPLMSSIAKGLLAIPASSASSERCFSAAGNIVTAQRYNLDPETTMKLTFCQQNWAKLQKHNWSLDKELEEMVTTSGAAPPTTRVPSPLPGTSSETNETEESQSILPS